MKIKLDLDLCQGHSVCVNECPEVFKVAEQDNAYPIVSLLVEAPAEELRSKVMSAAKYCPNNVISVDD